MSALMMSKVRCDIRHPRDSSSSSEGLIIDKFWGEPTAWGLRFHEFLLLLTHLLTLALTVSVSPLGGEGKIMILHSYGCNCVFIIN